MNLYPLKFRPILKERIWGGTKLRDVFGKEIPSETTGESWEISTVPGDISVIANGALAGKSFQDIIDKYHGAILGDKVFQRFGENFPILIKFIDACEDLSIQVHPNDKLAQVRHDSFGKTEMWFIMDNEPDAKLIVGFNKDTDREEYQAHLISGTLPNLLNYERVSKGNAYFINTGKIHAIGGGVLLAEIQQTSDITYRVYDFDRRDKNGNLRELHTELALDAIDYEQRFDFKVSYLNYPNSHNEVVSCPYFITNYLKIVDKFPVSLNGDAFRIYMCLEGGADFVYQGSKYNIRKGETLFVPASCAEYVIETTNAELLEVYI